MMVRAVQQGFTLLEMVVVLVLTGFLLAIVVPNVQRLYDSMVIASDRKALIAAFNRLPLHIQERGLSYTLNELPDKRLLHEDYEQLFADKDARLRAVEPIFISAAGRSEERRVGKECRCRWSAYH